MKTRENITTLVPGADAGTTSRDPAPLVSFVAFGVLCSMKNRRRMLKSPKTGKMFPAKSADAERYANDFLLQVPGYAKLSLGSSDRLLSATVRAFYPNWRSDLDCALVYDLLQAAGVVSNDRWIRRKIEDALIDAKNPRVEIEIRELRDAGLIR